MSSALLVQKWLFKIISSFGAKSIPIGFLRQTNRLLLCFTLFQDCKQQSFLQTDYNVAKYGVELQQ